MGCNCGGGRQAARSAAMAATGVPTAWRLKHPSGGTVDYYDGKVADMEAAKVPGATLTKVDVRTGQPIA
jgi:hypothetical protein